MTVHELEAHVVGGCAIQCYESGLLDHALVRDELGRNRASGCVYEEVVLEGLEGVIADYVIKTFYVTAYAHVPR